MKVNGPTAIMKMVSTKASTMFKLERNFIPFFKPETVENINDEESTDKNT